MKAVANYNNLSQAMMETFRKRYPIMKPGEVKKFKLLNIKPDPDNPGKMKMPFSKKVPARDRIFDKGDNTYKDIAFIASVGFNGQVTLGSINFYRTAGGMVVCKGGTADGQELCDYLLLSNYRDNNGERNKNVKPTFTLLDPKAIAKAEKEERDRRFEILKIAKELDEEKLKMMCLALGYDTSDEDVMQADVEKLAEQDPDAFLNAWSNPLRDKKAVFRDAVNKGIIKWVPAENKFVYGKSDTVLAVIPRGSGIDEIEELAQWSMKDDKTEAQYREIARQVLGIKKTRNVNA